MAKMEKRSIETDITCCWPLVRLDRKKTGTQFLCMVLKTEHRMLEQDITLLKDILLIFEPSVFHSV